MARGIVPGVRATMREYKAGKLRTGSGTKVRTRRQALAIGLSQERRAKRRAR